MDIMITCPRKNQLTRNAVRRNYKKITLLIAEVSVSYCKFIFAEFAAYINESKLISKPAMFR